jgi:hypothetical protein
MNMLLAQSTSRLDSQSMREQGVMRRQQHLVQAELQARGMIADEVAKMKEALGLIERDPMVDAVGKTIHDDFHVVRQPSRAVRAQPSAAQKKLIRVVPMKKRDLRFDSLGQ